MAGEAVYLGPRQVLGLGMILHELLTNALKYGALAHDGRIEVAWRREGDEVAFEWRERGLDGLAAPTATGFGTRMIAMTVGHELRGALSSEWLADGLVLEIRFPLGEAAP
ncbi:MAG: sensor histidine kinase [Novosphingobium sp.]|nr:sensor histidine kinase [Novosphingobium sp.]